MDGNDLRASDALLKGLVDYAGLFPPASENMRTALERYAEYRVGPDRAALGRFIVPLGRLRELEEQGQDLLATGKTSEPWRLSVLVGGDARGAAEELLKFNERHGSSASDANAVVDVVELKASEPAEIERQSAALPDTLAAYFELPLGTEIASLVRTLASVGRRAKIRTGGVTADAFPSPRQIAQFFVACHEQSVPFKATAGLHHPIRGTYPLTYERASDRGMMFGFLNVFIGAAIIHSGEPAEMAQTVLEETDPSAFAITDEAISWRGVSIGVNQIKALRSSFAISFGSCSFREPVDELAALDRSLMAPHR